MHGIDAKKLVRVDEIVRRVKTEGMNVYSAKKMIEDFFIQRPTEVFRKTDVAKAFSGKISHNTVKVTVTNLYNAGHIGRASAGGRIYYGSKEATERLTRELKKVGASFEE